MDSPPFLLSFASSFLSVLFLTCFTHNTVAQNPWNSPSGPSIARCGPNLLPLATCVPFAQGTVPLPAQQCCDNLNQLYNQQSDCLCLLLDDNALRSLPINRTLALQLPLLCSLQFDISICAGEIMPPNTPASQVSFGTTANSTIAKANSSIAAFPMVTAAPTPSILGIRFHMSGSGKNKVEHRLMVVAVAVFALVSRSVL